MTLFAVWLHHYWEILARLGRFNLVRFDTVRLYNRRDMKQQKCHTNNKSVRVYPICLFLSLKHKNFAIQRFANKCFVCRYFVGWSKWNMKQLYFKICNKRKRHLVTDGIDTSLNYQQKEKHPMPWTESKYGRKIIVKINGNRLLQIQYSNYCKYTRSERDPRSEGNTSKRCYFFLSLSLVCSLLPLDNAQSTERERRVHHPAANYYIISFKNYYSNIADTL